MIISPVSYIGLCEVAAHVVGATAPVARVSALHHA